MPLPHACCREAYSDYACIRGKIDTDEEIVIVGAKSKATGRNSVLSQPQQSLSKKRADMRFENSGSRVAVTERRKDRWQDS